jgi:hypothetical protein
VEFACDAWGISLDLIEENGSIIENLYVNFVKVDRLVAGQLQLSLVPI